MPGRLAERYRQHHAENRNDGEFIFVPERLPLFVAAVGGPGKLVLDLGCRTGAVAEHFLAGNDVVGVDIDRGALEHAAARGIKAIWADIEEPLPFEDGSFDVVVAGELLEHVRFADQVVAEIARVLRPDGVLVGSVPNAYRLKNRLKFLAGRPPERDPTHLRMFSPASIRLALAPLGTPDVSFVGGRLTRLHPRLFANDLVFVCRRQGAQRTSSDSAVSRRPSSSPTAAS